MPGGAGGEAGVPAIQPLTVSGDRHDAGLRGQRLYLRELTVADVAGAYLETLNDPTATRYMAAGRVPQTRETALEFLRALLAQGGRAYAICLVADDGHVGNIVLRPDWASGKGDIGILLWPSSWGHGYAGEAIRLLTAPAFRTLDLRRLTFWTHNPAAARAVRKFGWVHEGTLRQDARLGGECWDAVLYGLLREEWVP